MSILHSDKLPTALQWMNGSLAGRSMNDVLLIAPYALVGCFSLEIPAGIIMANAGGPYFLYLMRKGKFRN